MLKCPCPKEKLPEFSHSTLTRLSTVGYSFAQKLPEVPPQGSTPPNPAMLTASTWVWVNRQPVPLPAMNLALLPSVGQHWLASLKPVPPKRVTSHQIQAYLLQGEKGWNVKRWALPNCGIARESKDRVHTDQSSKWTDQGIGGECFLDDKASACLTDRKCVFGHQKPLPQGRSFL